MLNVMHVRDSSGLYGAERVILALAKYCDPERFRLSLLCLLDSEGNALPLIRQAKAMGVIVDVVKVRGVWDCRTVRSIRAALTAHQVDVVHTHDFKSTWFGWLASMGLGVKRVVTAHGSVKDSFKIRVSLWLEEWIMRGCFDRVIVVAEDLRRDFLKKEFLKNQLKLIQNGIDVSTMGATSGEGTVGKSRLRDEIVFGVIGRLVPDKGHRFFLQAFANMIHEYPHARALIVGGGPLGNDLRRQVEQMGLDHQVVFCGARDDMTNVYKEIQCLVIPSLREGLPYVLLEALATKIPVVATAVGDIPLLIRSKETGYLVPPGDVEELRKSMRAIVADRGTAARFAEEGYRLVVEQYSSNRMAEEVEQVYEEVSS